MIRMVKEDDMDRTCSTNGEKRNVYTLLVGKLEGNRPLRRSRRRWAYNIRMHIGVIGWRGIDWISLAQDRGQQGM
jgi:hypothetical protein